MTKKIKKPPFRLEALIPFAIVIFLFSIYSHFFFHSHVKNLIQFSATWINGAEVNIGSFKSSIFNASFEFKNIQITDPQNPKRNSIEIERIHSQALWDGLLRGKLIVELASVEGIAINSLRRTQGKTLSQSDRSSRQRTIEKTEKIATTHIQEEFSNNILSDMASIAGGNSSKKQLELIQGNLQTSKYIEKLKKELQKKQRSWQERLKTLPTNKALKELQVKLKNIKTSNFKNVFELQNSIERLKTVIDDSKGKYKTIFSANKELKQDISSIQKKINSINHFVKNDIQSLEKKLRIPSLDPKEISKSLFQKQFTPYLQKFDAYMKIAEEYMPPKKTAEQLKEERKQKLSPHKRHQGRNYHFGTSTSYPLVWIKKVVISSKENKSKNTGSLRGEILNISTNQSQINKPLIASISGDFPQKNIYGLISHLTIDHRSTVPSETLDLSVTRYPIETREISNTPEVKLIITEAQGGLKLKALRTNNLVTMVINNHFSSLKYEIDSKQKEIKNLVTNVMGNVPKISISASAKGSFPLMNWHISSNIGYELQKGFEQQIRERVKGAKRRIKKEVNGVISKQKNQLKKSMYDFKNQYQKEINNLKQEVQSTRKSANMKISRAKKQEGKKAKDKIEKELNKILKDKDAKKLLDDLKKKFKF